MVHLELDTVDLDPNTVYLFSDIANIRWKFWLFWRATKCEGLALSLPNLKSHLLPTLLQREGTFVSKNFSRRSVVITTTLLHRVFHSNE